MLEQPAGARWLGCRVGHALSFYGEFGALLASCTDTHPGVLH